MKKFKYGVELAVWMGLALLAGLLRTQSQSVRSTDEETDRGDVPGWVMITMMTSIVVIALLVVFREAVTKAVQDAFDAIVG